MILGMARVHGEKRPLVGVFFWGFKLKEMAYLTVRLVISTWNPKQPVLNGCLVKQPFPM